MQRDRSAQSCRWLVSRLQVQVLVQVQYKHRDMFTKVYIDMITVTVTLELASAYLPDVAMGIL